MRIIDNVKRPGFTQWCPDFVKRVIESTHMIICGNRVDTVEITEITDKRIYLSIYQRFALYHQNMELHSVRKRQEWRNLR